MNQEKIKEAIEMLQTGLNKLEKVEVIKELIKDKKEKMLSKEDIELLKELGDPGNRFDFINETIEEANEIVGENPPEDYEELREQLHKKTGDLIGG